MASEWPLLTLRAAGVSLIDCVHKTPPAADGGYPYIAIPQIRDGRLDLSAARYIDHEHFVEWTQRACPKANDVILSRRCNPGETAFVPPSLECALGQNLVLLQSDGSTIFPPFLRWLVRGPEWWEQVGRFMNVGAVFNSLKCAEIPEFALSIPPMWEQREIASILGALDDKIELNRRMNQTLEDMARALFKSWFVDFDPVGAKAEGRDPGLPAEIADLFPDTFEVSELGEIPNGWHSSTLATNFQLTMGQSPPGSTYNEIGNGLPFFQGRRDYGFRYPSNRVYCTEPTRIAEPGDTLVSVRAPVGDVNMAAERCCIGRGLAAVRHLTGSRSYSFYAMHQLRKKFQVYESGGTVFGSISKKDFQALPWISAPVEVVNAFECCAYPYDQKIRTNHEQANTLRQLRDALLPKLISGEIRVKEAESAVEEVV